MLFNNAKKISRLSSYCLFKAKKSNINNTPMAQQSDASFDMSPLNTPSNYAPHVPRGQSVTFKPYELSKLGSQKKAIHQEHSPTTPFVIFSPPSPPPSISTITTHQEHSPKTPSIIFSSPPPSKEFVHNKPLPPEIMPQKESDIPDTYSLRTIMDRINDISDNLMLFFTPYVQLQLEAEDEERKEALVNRRKLRASQEAKEKKKNRRIPNFIKWQQEDYNQIGKRRKRRKMGKEKFHNSQPKLVPLATIREDGKNGILFKDPHTKRAIKQKAHETGRFLA